MMIKDKFFSQFDAARGAFGKEKVVLQYFNNAGFEKTRAGIDAFRKHLGDKTVRVIAGQIHKGITELIEDTYNLN